MKPAVAKFEVPLNWSEEFLKFVLENSRHIYSVFGSLPDRPSGRPIPYSSCADKSLISQAKLKEIIARLSRKGIIFNLVMNMSCTGNTFRTHKGRMHLEKEIRMIYKMGVRRITVANFELARRISALQPKIEIIMSVVLNIKELDQLLYLRKEKFNLSGIVIGKGLYRNIPRLKKFVDKLGDLAAIAIVNDFCPFANCPERISDHNNSCAHKNLPLDPGLGEQRYVPPSLFCRQKLMENPTRHLCAPVINPNDLEIYEKAGIRYFKISDRIMPTKTLIRICQAYFQRSYDGNYFDLFSFTSLLEQSVPSKKRLSKEKIRAILENGYENFVTNQRSYFISQPFLSAKHLASSGFMDQFRKGLCRNNCFDIKYNRNGCKHCLKFANKFLLYNKKDTQAVIHNINLLNKLTLGKV